jgi:twitching motility two-component system response regulator PilG
MTTLQAPAATAQLGQAMTGTEGKQPESAHAALKLLVKGFNLTERKLLQGVVFLSKRRPPRLDLLEDGEPSDADIIMIDAADPQAVAWAQSRAELANKAVIWVDGQAPQRGHTVARPPVQWPMLPVLLYQALEPAPHKRPGAAGAVSTNRRILVIDDSLPVRVQLKGLLEPRGFAVFEADSAEAGLQAIASTPYACVLMDVMMPGIDGYEACRQIKSAHSGGKAPPVVMLTSKSSPFDRIRGKMAGCDDYLSKPVDPVHLHQVLSNFVNLDAPGPPRPAPYSPAMQG